MGFLILINAYKTGAQLALQNSKIIEKLILDELQLKFEYKSMNSVMRIIKEKNLNILNQTLELDCRILISVRKNDSQAIFDIFNNLYEIKIKEL